MSELRSRQTLQEATSCPSRSLHEQKIMISFMHLIVFTVYIWVVSGILEQTFWVDKKVWRLGHIWCLNNQLTMTKGVLTKFWCCCTPARSAQNIWFYFSLFEWSLNGNLLFAVTYLHRSRNDRVSLVVKFSLWHKILSMTFIEVWDNILSTIKLYNR